MAQGTGFLSDPGSYGEIVRDVTVAAITAAQDYLSKKASRAETLASLFDILSESLEAGHLAITGHSRFAQWPWFEPPSGVSPPLTTRHVLCWSAAKSN
jgi:hypothetical protein